MSDLDRLVVGHVFESLGAIWEIVEDQGGVFLCKPQTGIPACVAKIADENGCIKFKENAVPR